MRRGLEPILVGNAFARVEQRRADLRFPAAEAFRREAVGAEDRGARPARQIFACPARRRRGAGDASRHDRALLRSTSERRSAELGEFAHERAPAPKHEHIVFHLGDGTSVRYSDARRFGYMDLIPTERLDGHALFKGLGIEPLSPGFTAEWLAQRLKGKATSIKAALIDQKLIAGLGNIYACEALFRARISPLKRAGTLVTKIRQADQADRSAGGGDQGRARGRDQGRRLVAARLSPRRRRGSADSSTASRSMAARASPAQEKAAEEPYAASSREDARPSIVQPVNARGLDTIMFANVFTAREPEPEAPKTNGAYETILVSTKGKVGSSRSTARMR